MTTIERKFKKNLFTHRVENCVKKTANALGNAYAEMISHSPVSRIAFNQRDFYLKVKLICWMTIEDQKVNKMLKVINNESHIIKNINQY